MRRLLLTPAILLLYWSAALAQNGPRAADRFFAASDGTRLHYLEAGNPADNTIVFVPGWTMPAWIWTPQLDALARRYHVVALDPRGQGQSDVPATGYEPVRRGRDIADLLDRLRTRPAVVVGWSLGVLDALAAVQNGAAPRIAALVLVDNSVGEEPAPVPKPPPPRPLHPLPPPPRAVAMRAFVAAMFRTPRTEDYLRRLTDATLRTPESAAKLLLAYPVPRTYWREAVYAFKGPVLYAVRPKWVPQAENLLKKRPRTEVEVFEDAGHALFVDEPARFDAMLDSFVRRNVWP